MARLSGAVQWAGYSMTSPFSRLPTRMKRGLFLYLLCLLTAPRCVLRAEDARKPAAAEVLSTAPGSRQSAGTQRMVERLAAIPREVDPFLIPYFAGKTADL